MADWDADGLPDLIVNSILGKVVWLKNIGTRTAPQLEAPRPIEVNWEGSQPTLAWGWLKPNGNELLTQWRTTPVVFDFNRDGLLDLAILDTQGYIALFERVKRGEQLALKAPRRAFLNEQGTPLRLNPGEAARADVANGVSPTGTVMASLIFCSILQMQISTNRSTNATETGSLGHQALWLVAISKATMSVQPLLILIAMARLTFLVEPKTVVCTT